MTPQTQTPVPVATLLPVAINPELSNSSSKLIQIGSAAVTLREMMPEAKTTWKKAMVAFQGEARKSCAAYDHFRGEDFSMLCNSGADGVYFRGDACFKCQLLAGDNDPNVREKDGLPIYQAPVGYALVPMPKQVTERGMLLTMQYMSRPITK
jgi:hypothetical protein